MMQTRVSSVRAGVWGWAVYLTLSHAAMAQQHLDDTNVGAVVQQVSGKAVAPMPSSGLCRVNLYWFNDNLE